MSIVNKILAESFSSIEDVNRAIKKVAEQVSDLLDLQRKTEKQLASVVATLMFQVDVGDKKSPTIHVQPEHFKVPSLDKLRKNYSIVQELFETRTALDAMEAKIATSFSNKKDVSTDKARAEISKLKRQVDIGLQEAFSFLANLARKHMPESVAAFTKTVCAILERSVVYESASMFSYVYEVEGDIVFTNYIHLKNLEDEAHKSFPELFVCCTYRSGANPGMYVSILHKFAPPSEDLLLKKVGSPKDAARALSLLLELDSFENSLGSLPMNVVLKPSSIQRDMFSYSGYIKNIQVDENEIRFELRPSATAEGKVDTIVSQLYKELNSLQRRTNAKLRMSVKKAKSGDTIQFYFVAPKSAPPVSADDLAFLKDRFNMSDDTLHRVVKIVNQGD